MPVQLISLDLIDDNPYQDRGTYKEIEELGRTIALNGLEQLPKARQTGKRFQLKFGHRRKRAFEWLRDHWKAEGLTDRYSGYSVMPLDVEDFSENEMFDGVVIENVHRDDLKVTEKARLLQRYKRMHPEATSEQIGLVFNMNGATVRGMDMFLDLYPELQAALDDGTITQGAARVFHSMQKIAPKEKVLKTLHEVVKKKGNALPEEVIDNAIHHLDNTVEMWEEGYRQGKPRGGDHGWTLEMKNFPNHLLPAMTEEQVGAFEAQLEHLNEPPACSACPFYTKVRGSHYCGMKLCFRRKEAAWERLAVEQASKQTNIPVYTKEDGAYRPLDYYEQSKQAFAKKHKGLRLMPKSMIGHYTYQDYTKLNDDLVVVVATGDDLLGKLARSANSGRTVGGKKSEKEKAEMRMTKVYRIRRKELLWEYTAAAQVIFEGVPLNALKKINRWEHILMDDSIPGEYDHPQTGTAAEQAEFQRRALVWRLIMSETSHNTRSPLTDILTRFTKITGVKAPKTLVKRAEAWESEVKAAGKGVAAATKGKMA